jgi:hypothetical protein
MRKNGFKRQRQGERFTSSSTNLQLHHVGVDAVLLFSGHSLLGVTAPAPHTTGRLLAVSPDMAELLAVVTLRETSLGFMRLCPDCSMAKARQFEYLMGL